MNVVLRRKADNAELVKENVTAVTTNMFGNIRLEFGTKSLTFDRSLWEVKNQIATTTK